MTASSTVHATPQRVSEVDAVESTSGAWARLLGAGETVLPATALHVANLKRVEHLVSLYESARSTGSGRASPAASDLLRAAVVWIHAANETLLRQVLAGVARVDMPHVVAVYGRGLYVSGNSEAVQKITLDDLVREAAERPCETLAGFVDRSLTTALNRLTFNNSNQFAQALSTIGVDATTLRFKHPQSNNAVTALPVLAAIAGRRHKIVHESDVNPETGRGQHQTRSIGRLFVIQGIAASRAMEVAIHGSARLGGPRNLTGGGLH